jgi:thioredoxin 1
MAFSAIILLMQVSVLWRARKAHGRTAPDTSLIDGDAAPYSRRVYYFYGRNCGPCKAMTPTIDKLGKDHPNLVKVDVGQHLELAKNFGVSATHTIMLVEGGVIRKVKLGGMRESQLKAMLSAQ